MTKQQIASEIQQTFGFVSDSFGGSTIDVVIIGGGVQGLILLDTLTDAGYSCALVTEGDLGGGQTLHSHGFLNTGFGMPGPRRDELPRAAMQVVYPYLSARGVELNDNWVVIAPPGLPGLDGLQPAGLPAGFSPAFGGNARKLPNRSFSKRRLVEALARGRERRIIRGTVTGFVGHERVESVAVQPDGGHPSIALKTGAVVVAAGCGSKQLIRSLVGSTPQVEAIKHRLVHMVCLRGPRGGLPAVSIAAVPLSLLIAAHEDSDGVTWYVTPMEMEAPSFDDVPHDASATVAPAVLARTRDALLALYPELPDTEGLAVGSYAGYRQDIGDGPGTRMCELIAGTGNVIAALPSGLVAPWLNAADTRDLLRPIVDPSGEGRELSRGGEGVRVGNPVEQRPGFRWTTWQEWTVSLSGAGTSG
ncbi:MAG TPA: FAD-dependent oxidoreductase [Chloroflexota bacterium]